MPSDGVVQSGEWRPGKWKTVYQGDREVPCFGRHYAEGDWLVYGSGRIEVAVRALPIVVRMRWGLTGPHPTVLTPVAQRVEASMALQKIVKPTAGATAVGPGVNDQSDWPHLLEHLITTAYGDGTARQPSTLIIVADTGGWRGCVADKDNDRTLWKAATSVLDLLTALEQALAEDDPTAWRQSAASKWKGKKRG